jgi:hypothetical protein
MEEIFRPVARDDEAESLFADEPFDGAIQGHDDSFWCCAKIRDLPQR